MRAPLVVRLLRMGSWPLLGLLLLAAGPGLAMEDDVADVDPGPTVTLGLESPTTGHLEVQLQPLSTFAAAFRPRLAVLDDAGAVRPPAEDGAGEPAAEGAAPSPGRTAGEQAEERVVPEPAPAQTPAEIDISRYPRVRGIHEETRVFWYAAGASALTSLVVRVLAAVPLLIGGFVLAAVSVAIGPAATLALAAAGCVGLAAIDAGIAALSASLVFDQLSELYSSSYLSAFGGQFLGNAGAFAVGGVVGGFGLALILGVTTLQSLLGTMNATIIIITMLSVFGLIPAIVVGFFASVALPALIGAWAISSSARPREGFLIDPGWDPLGPSRLSTSAERVPSTGRDVRLFSPRLLLPGT